MKHTRRFTSLMTAAVISMLVFTGSMVSTVSAEAAFSFGELAQTKFVFSSGVGAWATEMKVAADGTISGEYHDSDMGSSGDGYDATVYMCTFQGSFTDLTQVGSNAYEVTLANMKIKNANGTSEIKDRTRYEYSLPYGILTEDGTKPASKLTIYTTGTSVSELPDSFTEWAYEYMDGSKTILEDYCIYNNDTDTWFIGYTEQNAEASTAESAATSAYPEPWNTKLTNALNQAAQLEAEMQSGDKQYYATQLYYVWDNLLNEIWQAYPQSTKDNLLNAQLEWIYAKEARQASYSTAWEGTLYAAQTTKERVYVLLQYV